MFSSVYATAIIYPKWIWSEIMTYKSVSDSVVSRISPRCQPTPANSRAGKVRFAPSHQDGQFA